MFAPLAFAPPAAPRFAIRTKIALIAVKLIPGLPRRQTSPADRTGDLWLQYLAYLQTSRDFHVRFNAAETEQDRKDIEAEWHSWDDGNELPRYYEVVDAIRALPPSLNASAARLMIEATSEFSNDLSLNSRDAETIVFALRSTLPFLTGPVAKSVRGFMACVDAGKTFKETQIWH